MSIHELEAARDALRVERNRYRNVVAVLGPPCSGKTTFVAATAGPADVVIDFDALAVALGSRERYDHSKAHLAVAHAAREAAVERALRSVSPPARIFVILSTFSQLAQFGLSGVPTHVMETSLDECERRAVAAGRTAAVLDMIRHWRS